MKKTFQIAGLLILFIFTMFSNTAYSQLGNSNMTLLANKNQHPSATMYSALWGYRAPNGREYAILGCATGTAFIEITDTANIVERDFLTGNSSSWREMKTYSHYAYIVSEASNSGLQIVDLQYLPDSVHLVRTFFYTGYTHTHSIQQDGPYLYLNGGNVTSTLPDHGGVKILDLTSNPELPVVRGGWGTYYIHDCRVRNDTMYACNIYDPPGTVSVINVANKDNPVTINSWVNNPNPFPHNCALVPNGRTYIYTTDETATPPGKLKVWNISNLSNVTFVTSWQPTGITNAIVHNVEIYGNYALVAHYTAGIRLIDISNPTSPTEIAYYDTYPSNNNNTYNGLWGVYMFPSGKIIGSDRQTGLYVVKPTIQLVGINVPSNNSPEKFELKQNYPNPFNPSTNIEFNIKKSGYVTLKVYDILGRQVALLADEFKQAGSYKVSYDAGRLSSGIYYYTLQTDNGFSETKKMVLNK
ncbi:MAG: choice-of-anchor B family protein [Ignavibacteria bacterium]|nr:choice-of-anchor B family protein [Ignavibacteria bacterium]